MKTFFLTSPSSDNLWDSHNSVTVQFLRHSGARALTKSFRSKISISSAPRNWSWPRESVFIKIAHNVIQSCVSKHTHCVQGSRTERLPRHSIIARRYLCSHTNTHVMKHHRANKNVVRLSVHWLIPFRIFTPSRPRLCKIKTQTMKLFFALGHSRHRAPSPRNIFELVFYR